jgi:hypothetical protein
MRDVIFYRDDNRSLALDLIYPSGAPVSAVGTVLEFSCDNKDRMGNSSLSGCSDTLLDGFATEGFAVAMADHPVAAPYKGIDPMPASAWKIKAAVRTLRATNRSLGLGERIVPVGFSRGSGMALMLLTTETRLTESPHALHQMTVLRNRLAELGNDEIFMLEREARGHKVALDPAILAAMNAYLKRRLSAD